MRWKLLSNGLLCVIAIASTGARAQDNLSHTVKVEVSARLTIADQQKHRSVPAVLWLEALEGTPVPPFPPHGRYTLLQKDRMFTPHLLVVPVGSVVSFPNADPFFHNVFSLFDGKRFDLGLYEAGSSKEVPFQREGVSYIFCNIHPQMGAVVLSLSTPLYAVADSTDSFTLHNVPAGDYKVHVWVEGVPQSTLDGLTHRIHLLSGSIDLGEFHVSATPQSPVNHTNKFGRAYDQDTKPTY